MITFLACLFAHCFGERPLEDHVWIVGLTVASAEVLFSVIALLVVLK